MYIVEHPKIHMAKVVSYKHTGLYEVKDERVFKDEHELVDFLAQYNHPVYNFGEKRIPNKYSNVFMDSQALDGFSRRGMLDNPSYEELKLLIYPKNTPSTDYIAVNKDWKINSYIFWLDAPGQPNFDVRNLRAKVNAESEKLERQNSFYRWYSVISTMRLKSQGRKRHRCWPWRGNSRYIQRARAAYGMEAEEEYKEFVKKKDKDFKSCWPSEDFGCRSGGTGWKDNSGSRYRYQWEPKAERNFKKNTKSISGYRASGRRESIRCKRRTKEELEDEVQMLREEFGC